MGAWLSRRAVTRGSRSLAAPTSDFAELSASGPPTTNDQHRAPAYIAAVATYIGWYLGQHILEDDRWCYAELDETRWVMRYVEQRDNEDVFFAAASLAEEMQLRDEEGLPALSAYHHTYGWTPDQPIDDFSADDVVEYCFKEISPAYFEQVWQRARRACDAGRRVHTR